MAASRARRSPRLTAVGLAVCLAALGAGCGRAADDVGFDPDRPSALTVPIEQQASAALELAASIAQTPRAGGADGGASGIAAGQATTAEAVAADPRWEVDPASSGQPFPQARVEGLLTFRGNPTRSFTGAGPVPASPTVRWTYPQDGGLCRTSSDGGVASLWCGTGWTGQPALWRWGDRWAVAFGAYDGAVHVLDAATGAPILPPFATGDLIKGSVSVDPDGFPLLYVGSRDGQLRVIAIDRPVPTELWRLPAEHGSPTLWNDDWDASPLVLGDLLLVGGENSRFHVVKLNRRLDADGKVTVAPRLVFDDAGWDPQLLADLGDTNVSIESSVTVVGHVAYTANSGGLIVGWDLNAIAAGVRGPDVRVFRFWMGDDTDATVVADAEGFLYVAAEYERGNARAAEVGQLVKLDPRRPDQPLLWSVPLRSGGIPAGVWATPALYGDVVIVATNAGEVLAVDRADGSIRWNLALPGPTWGSPVVVDGVLLQGDCAGVLHAWDVTDTRAAPRPLWNVSLGGCIESTPAVYGGTIVVGTRGGKVFALGEAG